jgi:pimeloyl-ACP methyl ester carboxylesterase
MELKIKQKNTFIATGGKVFDPSKPVLLMLHGAGMDHTVWSMQARYFAHHGFSVLNPDLPGHGRSDGSPPGSIPEYSAWVIDLLIELGVRDVYLMGHSMGSLIALACAVQYKEQVRKLALLGTLPHIQVHPSLLKSAQNNDHVAYETIVGWGVGRRAQMGGHKAPGSWVTGANMRLLEAGAPNLLGNDLAACDNWEDGLKMCAEVLCPALLLLGSDDKMTPPKGTQKMADTIKDCRTIILKEAGHMMMMEQPDQTLDSLSTFFER